MLSISSIKLPNTLPCPQPVVTTFLAVRASMLSMPLRVLTAAEFTSQSTEMDSISPTLATKRWLRKKPSTNSSGCAPKVISVTSSRLSTYTVKSRSAGMAVLLRSPCSLTTHTSWVSGARAWLRWGSCMAEVTVCIG